MVISQFLFVRAKTCDCFLPTTKDLVRFVIDIHVSLAQCTNVLKPYTY